MRTNTNTTQIILDRGTEDVELLNDIKRIFSDSGETSVKNIARRYPKLLELQHELQWEMEE